MEIQYFGWSGITLHHTNILVGFDLFGDDVTWDKLPEHETLIICLTHGHPEHAGSIQDFLEAPEGRSRLHNVHLISSLDVIEHINRHRILSEENTHAINDGDTVTIKGVTISGFTWVHMPLLPPKFQEKLEYIFQLMIHPIDLIKIGMLSLKLPMNAPQLGFHVTYPDGTSILNYSEGVHRLTNSAEVKRVAKNLPADTLLFAVEPDDTEAIPRWIKILNPETVFIYEAHRPWRDMFHLPFIDLEQYAQALSKQFPEITFTSLTQTHQLVVETQ